MKLTVNIDSEDDCVTEKEISRVLRVLADRIKLYKHNNFKYTEGKILSIDGNGIGNYEFYK